MQGIRVVVFQMLWGVILNHQKYSLNNIWNWNYINSYTHLRTWNVDRYSGPHSLDATTIQMKEKREYLKSLMEENKQVTIFFVLLALEYLCRGFKDTSNQMMTCVVSLLFYITPIPLTTSALLKLFEGKSLFLGNRIFRI